MPAKMPLKKMNELELFEWFERFAQKVETFSMVDGQFNVLAK